MGGAVQISIKLVFVLLSLMILTSCAGVPAGKIEVEEPLQPLSCIIVLPTSTSVGNDDTINYEQARTLEKGAAYTSMVINRELKDNSKVRILNSIQAASLVPEVSGGISGTMAALGEKLNCDGVLVSTVSRYRQRIGNDYGVDTPASADFKLVLRHSATGRVLWSSDFRETQQTVLSNVLSLSKAQSRGFKWITVEKLVEQGVQERLSECPYLE